MLDRISTTDLQPLVRVVLATSNFPNVVILRVGQHTVLLERQHRGACLRRVKSISGTGTATRNAKQPGRHTTSIAAGSAVFLNWYKTMCVTEFDLPGMRWAMDEDAKPIGSKNKKMARMDAAATAMRSA